MNEYAKIAVIAFIAAVVGGFTAGLIGSQSDSGVGGSRFPSGLSADGTSPSSGEVRGTTLTITGAQTLSGATTLSSTLTVSGDVTVDTNDLFVDVSANRTGLGTTTPQGRLHIEDAPAGDGTVATTTMFSGQTGTTTSRSAFEVKRADGTNACAYIAGTSWVIEAGACN